MKLPKVGESVFIAGNPNSGKTVLTKFLWRNWLPYFRGGIVLQVDYDLENPWESFCNRVLPPSLTSEQYLEELRTNKTICVDGTRLDFSDLKIIWNRLLGVALARGNVIVVCDEIARVTESNSLTPNHFLMLSGRGRKRLCSVIQATQRLQKCSMDVRTLSVHKFIFRLDERDVTQYADKFMPHASQILKLRPYHCLYSHPSDGGRTVVEILPPCPIQTVA